jgi:hypothetical protein
MTYRHANIRNLTYSEFLATLPWVMLRPNYATVTEHCQQSRRGPSTMRPCKVTPRLVYLTLDGELTYWCHHHLGDFVSEEWWGDDDREVVRVKDWWKKHERAAFTEKKLPLEDVDYARHLKVNDKRCDVDPTDLDLDEAGVPE